MSTWTKADLLHQFSRAETSGWIPFFTASSLSVGLPIELLLALASRETNMHNIKGDFQGGIFHGFGIMQVDIGTDPAFCHAWTPENVQGSIQRGAEILGEKRDSLAAKHIADLKSLAAAYNAGAGTVAKAIHDGIDPDTRTTGKDYGRDVMARMAEFVLLLTPHST